MGLLFYDLRRKVAVVSRPDSWTFLLPLAFNIIKEKAFRKFQVLVTQVLFLGVEIKREMLVLIVIEIFFIWTTVGFTGGKVKMDLL